MLTIFFFFSYSLFFRKEHLELPLNKGEKRESLIILEKVKLVEGLLRKLGTEAAVSRQARCGRGTCSDSLSHI